MKLLLIFLLCLPAYFTNKTDNPNFFVRLAGSNTAYLTCKSESGRTIFKAEILDIDGSLESAVLTVDGQKLIFTDNDDAFCIFDNQIGFYSLYLVSKGKEFQFLQCWSIPSSFKTVINTSAHQKYEFKARIFRTSSI
jgi:hypothetical protein